jgi:hypothetical protein
LRIAIAAALSTAALAFVLPSTASADMADCKPKLERNYSKHYRQVAHKHGTRAPGRNIRRQGVLFRHVTFRATCGEIRRSDHQLKKLLARPTFAELTRLAVPPPQPPAGVQSTTQRATGGPLASIRACESGGNYATNTGNGFYGAYQFTLETWQAMGGSGLPSNASPAEQDMRAAKLWNGGAGAGNWPVCGH